MTYKDKGSYESSPPCTTGTEGTRTQIGLFWLQKVSFHVNRSLLTWIGLLWRKHVSFEVHWSDLIRRVLTETLFWRKYDLFWRKCVYFEDLFWRENISVDVTGFFFIFEMKRFQIYICPTDGLSEQLQLVIQIPAELPAIKRVLFISKETYLRQKKTTCAPARACVPGNSGTQAWAGAQVVFFDAHRSLLI